MTTNQQRQALMHAYVSDKWFDKVAHMSDKQVHAIYLRLKSQGRI